MSNEFLPNMTFVPYFKGFPTITHITFLDFPCVSFEEFILYVHFGISCYNLMCKLVQFIVHVQIHSMRYQQGFAPIIGPYMRLYRPMQSEFKLHAHEPSIALHHIPAINRSSCSFKNQPEGDLNCCWIENQTLTKGIFSFLFHFQAWISTSLVDLHSSIP